MYLDQYLLLTLARQELNGRFDRKTSARTIGFLPEIIENR